MELIFESVIKTYYKLQEIGFIEVEGKIVFVDDMGVKSFKNIHENALDNRYELV